jgi:exopolyphosphatase/guanosine-5'-triphosphate,3'-diphosphate pyrophosphatase
MRVATIDIGTNTVLLLVAERSGQGKLEPVRERATITRLGQGVDRTRKLAPEAIGRTIACLDEYAAIVRQCGVERTAVVGTSAMRDAHGGDEIADRVRAAFGVDVQVLSGDAEARLTFAGGTSGLDVGAGEPVAVFDIGGGSTEVILGHAGSSVIEFARSFDVGSVRLTERHIAHDPATAAELAAVESSARATFGGVPPLMGDGPPIGVAGTVTTLAAVSLGLVPYDGAQVHGMVLDREALRGVVRRLAAMDVETRRAVRGMEPKRADVIVAGGLIVLAILDHWNCSAVRVSDRGVRWGLAEELSDADRVTG